MSEKASSATLIDGLIRSSAEQAQRHIVPIFPDRRSAAVSLLPALHTVGYDRSWINIAIPKGGIPIADTIVERDIPIYPVFAKKIPISSSDTRFGIGAIGPQGKVVWNVDLITDLDGLITEEQFAVDGLQERLDLLRQNLGGKQLSLNQIEGRDVAVFDDGISTGLTMRAVCESLQIFSPRRLLIAAPIAYEKGVKSLEKAGFTDVCIHTVVPENNPFLVDYYYQSFPDLSEAEVRPLLQR